MNYKEKLLYAISQSNKSAYKISKETGISQQTIGSWKEKMPAFDKAMIVLKYLGVSLDELFENEIKDNLTVEEKELLGLFRRIPVEKQQRFLGRVDEIIKDFPTEQADESYINQEDQADTFRSSTSKIG